jgi:hypothetical protein
VSGGGRGEALLAFVAGWADAAGGAGLWSVGGGLLPLGAGRPTQGVGRMTGGAGILSKAGRRRQAVLVMVLFVVISRVSFIFRFSS